jgi:hypothetical protein
MEKFALMLPVLDRTGFGLGAVNKIKNYSMRTVIFSTVQI